MTITKRLEWSWTAPRGRRFGVVMAGGWLVAVKLALNVQLYLECPNGGWTRRPLLLPRRD